MKIYQLINELKKWDNDTDVYGTLEFMDCFTDKDFGSYNQKWTLELNDE